MKTVEEIIKIIEERKTDAEKLAAHLAARGRYEDRAQAKQEVHLFEKLLQDILN